MLEFSIGMADLKPASSNGLAKVRSRVSEATLLD